MNESFTEAAAKTIVSYAAARGAPFLIEDVRYWHGHEFVGTADGRAWGGAAKRAASWGSIKRVGYAAANSSNRSPKVLWQYTGKDPS